MHAGRRGQGRRRDRGVAGRRGAADPAAAARPDRRGRGADRGPGAGPRAPAGLPARHRGARADGRRRARLRAGPRLAGRRRRRSTATRRWRSWPGGSWPGTARPSDRDLAKWAGLPLRRRPPRPGRHRGPSCAERADGLADLAAERRGRTESRRRGCSGPSTRCCTAGCPASRSCGPHRGIVTVNGLFRPFALVDGRAVATWGLAGRRRRRWTGWRRCPAAARAALAADEADVRRFLGLA